MSEWTHFAATITIENRGELNPMFYLKRIKSFQQKVERGETTWDDIYLEHCDNCNTAPAWTQMIQHCFIPNEHSRDMIPNAMIYIDGLNEEYSIDNPECPFENDTFPLGHIKCCTRFYQNVSPDGRNITFSYEGDKEELMNLNEIELWVNHIEELFYIRSGVVAVRNEEIGVTKVWTLGSVGGIGE